jgi:hypothetical protein
MYILLLLLSYYYRTCYSKLLWIRKAACQHVCKSTNMGNINALYNLVVVDVVLFEGYAYIFTD